MTPDEIRNELLLVASNLHEFANMLETEVPKTRRQRFFCRAQGDHVRTRLINAKRRLTLAKNLVWQVRENLDLNAEDSGR